METKFDSSRAFQHLNALAEEIGPRPSGSDADRRAAEYIRGHFESLGIPTQEQGFEIPGGMLKSHTVEILEPALGEIPSYPFLFSADTPRVD